MVDLNHGVDQLFCDLFLLLILLIGQTDLSKEIARQLINAFVVVAVLIVQKMSRLDLRKYKTPFTAVSVKRYCMWTFRVFEKLNKMKHFLEDE